MKHNVTHTYQTVDPTLTYFLPRPVKRLFFNCKHEWAVLSTESQIYVYRPLTLVGHTTESTSQPAQTASICAADPGGKNTGLQRV